MLSRVWGVGALVKAVADTLQSRYGRVSVQGELSSWTRAASGHVYFTLKDEQGVASLRCVMFRRTAVQQLDVLQRQPSEGQRMEVSGQLSVYEGRGELQLLVDEIKTSGAGALYEQFLKLRAELEAQGWFDAARKRPIPRYPKRVAVITSPSGAAVADVLTTLKRRSPHVEIWVLPCLVQGVEAPPQIVQALQWLQTAHAVDVAILCRGGGALEDLWAFNDPRVVRAVAQCEVPVVCGVGHETDVTLADLAADLRAPTPTAAAEMVACPLGEAQAVLDEHSRRMLHAARRYFDRHVQRLDHCAWRLESVRQMVPWHRERLLVLNQRMTQATKAYVQRRHQWHEHWALRMESIHPRNVLQRGYAWLQDEQGRAIASVDGVRPHQTLRVQLIDGVLQVQVQVQDVSPLPSPGQALHSSRGG